MSKPDHALEILVPRARSAVPNADKVANTKVSNSMIKVGEEKSDLMSNNFSRILCNVAEYLPPKDISMVAPDCLLHLSRCIPVSAPFLVWCLLPL